MNFTREPIIETIITPKEGYKLVLRSSKGGAQEELFVDAVEVVSFGHNCFYRSLEKPKSFLVPAADYEILEVRETRVVLKTQGVEKGGIKIGGGREAALKVPREPKEAEEMSEEPALTEVEATAAVVEQRGEKRKERRRFRKRRGKGAPETEQDEEGNEPLEAPFPEELAEQPPKTAELPKPREERAAILIPPPSTLISENLARYKDTPVFANAFYEKKEEPISEKAEGEQESKRVLLEESDDLDFFAEEKPEESALDTEEDDETL